MTPPAEPPSRAALHAVLAIGGALAFTAGDAIGATVFRRTVPTADGLVSAAITGALVGTLAAIVIWMTRSRSS